MYEILQTAVRNASSLDEIRRIVVPVLFTSKNSDSAKRLAYVSGIISSDGPEEMPKNISLLHERTNRIAEIERCPVFGPTYIFTDEVYGRIDPGSITTENWNNFWGSV